ncbi:MAG: hypothetical protein AB1801_06965 [Chloroflexota bacterium]
MKLVNVKLVVAVVIGGLLAGWVAAWNSTQAEAKTMDPAATVITGTVTVPTTDLARLAEPATTPAQATTLHYQAGTLLQGSDDAIYYLTEAGARRRILDRETLRAFGFAEQYIIRVDDNLLATIPPAEDLTRLVRYPQGNLYWVMDGQRWLVNEWLPVASQPDYAGAPVTALDSWLEHSLPVRLNFDNGTLLADGQAVYSFNFGSITPVDDVISNQAAIVEVPAGVLATYRPDGG